MEIPKATSNNLNITTGGGKGLEKAIGVIATFVVNAQNKTNQIIYGKNALSDTDGTALQRALDKGILNILDIFASVDFCNLLNYAFNQLPDGKEFDPNNPPNTDDPIEKKKFKIQKKAFDLQKLIDGYKSSYADSSNSESKNALFNLVQSIRFTINEFLSSVDGLNDPTLRADFPEITLITNYVQNVVGYFDRYSNIESLSPKELQKFLSTVDKVRVICVTITSLKSAKGGLSIADSLLGGRVQQEITKISQLIPVEKAIPLIRSLLKTANNVVTVGQKLIGYINTARAYIKIFLGIIKILKIIISALKKLPLPNMFTVVGITTTISDIARFLDGEFIKKLIKRLEQINFVLNLIAIFATSLVIAMQQIIAKLNLIALNLDSCNRKDKELKDEINNTIKSLQNTINPLQSFLDQYNSADQKAQRQFGEYTIEIITEQVTDEGISLKRRYGIARGSNGIIVAQSTPTFASLDLIIINEVKLLLSSKGLIKSSIPTLSPNDFNTVLESTKYLGEENVNLEDLDLDLSEGESTALEDSELQLGTFIDNLPGGKALRKRTRKLLIADNEKLKADTGRSGPVNTDKVLPDTEKKSK